MIKLNSLLSALGCRREAQRVFRFLLAGGIAATANFVARIILDVWLDYVASIILAYVLGMVVAFCLNARFVFPEGNTPLPHKIAWFTAINLLAILQTLLISVFLADWAFPAIGWHWYPETVAHAIGIVAPIVTSYIGHSRMSFRSVDPKQDQRLKCDQ